MSISAVAMTPADLIQFNHLYILAFVFDIETLLYFRQ